MGLAREDKGTPPPFVLLPAVLPAIGYNPAMGALFGLTGTLGMYLGPPATTTISSLQGVALYSTMSQLTIQVSTTVLTARNDWELQGDWRFLLFNQKTYGLGTGPAGHVGPRDERGLQPGAVSTRRCSARSGATSTSASATGSTATTTSRTRTWTSRRPEPVVGPDYAYSLAYGFNPHQGVLSGATLAVLYDSRDSTIDPYRGYYGSANFTVNPTWLGSSQASTNLEAQFRVYAPLDDDVPRNVLGFWLYYRGITSGAAPYLALPSIGWDQKNRTGRGYVQGRWRGTQELYGEVEWRFRITNNGLLGGVVFANARASPRRPSRPAARGGPTRARRSGSSSSSVRPVASACAS